MRHLVILGVVAALLASACGQTGELTAPQPEREAGTADIGPAGSTAATIISSTSTTDPESTTTSPPPLPETFAEFLRAELGPQWGLIPGGGSVEGDRSVIDVTFTDGTRIHVLHPADWPLEDYGWTPSTYIVYEPDEPRPDGGSVIAAQLIFTYGEDDEWSVGLHQMAVWTDEELDLAESHVTLSKEANGFVTVTTTRPFSHFTHDLDQAPLTPDYSTHGPWIDVGDILGLAATYSCGHDHEYPYPQREAHSVTWCDEDAGVVIAFMVPEIYHDEILDSVDVVIVP